MPCTTAAIAAEGYGYSKLEVYPGAGSSGEATTSTGDSGLSTAALVGICVGAAVGVAIIAMVIYLIIGCRRKNTVDRAVASRSKSSKRGERQPLPPAEDSKWRQMYSARMSDSMRRAEEATAKAQVQSRGPSFLEVKDQEFAQQAAMATDGQAKPSLSGKQSFGRGSSQAEVNSAAKLDDSPDHSLMAGSELSSPQPSVGGSKRKLSFKKLFNK